MFGGVEVFCRVFVLGGIAAADVAALQTQAEMHPVVSALQAFFTPFRGARRYVPDLVEMCTLCHAFIVALFREIKIRASPPCLRFIPFKT